MRYQQSLIDRAYSISFSLKYKILEPLLLRLNRWKYKKAFGKAGDPLISIVIATYNRGHILVERTIPAILGQTYKNFEILIIGDNCIDNTQQLIKKIHDPRVRFYDLPKRGEYPADPKLRWFVQGTIPRNKGLAIASGDWLAWISDDDIVLPNHMNSLLRFAQQCDFEFVSADYIVQRHGKNEVVAAKNCEKQIGGMQTWLYRSYLRFFQWNVHSWRKSWDRPTDYDLQFRMLGAGVRMGVLNEIVAFVPPVEGLDTVGFEAQATLSE